MSDIFSEFRRNAAISRFLADNRNAFLAQMRHENLGLARQSRDAIGESRELLRMVDRLLANGQQREPDRA